jgi:DNA-directed RNA polymerase specialized sigma24 family protein
VRLQIGMGEWDGDEAMKRLDILFQAANEAALGLTDILRFEDALTSDPVPSEDELRAMAPSDETKYDTWSMAVNTAIDMLNNSDPEVATRGYSRREWAVRVAWMSAAGSSGFQAAGAMFEAARTRGYLQGWAEGQEQSDRLVNLLGADVVKLEPHQRRVLLMVADGLSNEEIGAAMRTPPLTKRTVKYHCATAAKCLGLSAADLRRRLRKGTV